MWTEAANLTIAEAVFDSRYGREILSAEHPTDAGKDGRPSPRRG